MANIRAAKKSLRSDARKTVYNLKKKREMKEALKKVKDLVVRKNKEEAIKALPAAYKKIDKALKRGIIKKNNASRKKSSLSQSIKKI